MTDSELYERIWTSLDEGDWQVDLLVIPDGVSRERFDRVLKQVEHDASENEVCMFKHDEHLCTRDKHVGQHNCCCHEGPNGGVIRGCGISF